MDRVFRVAMAQVVLNEPQIVALVRQVEATRVTQLLRVDGPQPRPLGGRADQVIPRLARDGSSRSEMNGPDSPSDRVAG